MGHLPAAVAAVPETRAAIDYAMTRGPRSGALAEDLDDVARAFGGIAARGGKVLIVYGSGDSGRTDLEKYLGKGLEKARREPAIRVAIIDGADHTLTPRISQRRTHDAIAEFFEPLP